ncbi:MAG TPA: dihydrolipoamide acetyltransferase family protein [Fimbriimonadaceae bacterium]|jgi:pyruvate dehydrogenase E2 component (dihydrolipoamide acetyltransferase)
MTEVIMPKMGDGMEEGTLLEWLKKDGEKVKSGEVIGTIQTDKATLELEAPGSGVLTGFLINSGETVPVGRKIAALLKEGEALPQGWGGNGSAKAANGAASEAKPEAAQPASGATEGGKAEAAPAPQAAAPVEAAPAPSNGNDRIKASPLARKIAAEMGVNLGQIKGTGPGGRIVEKDVKGATPAAAPAPPAIPAVAATAGDTTIQLNRLRQITAQRTQQSKQQVPHFYVTVSVDVENIMKLREQFEAEESGKVSINDFVMKACVVALQQMPIVNSVFQGQTLLRVGAIHLGMAVALEEGLTVPVIKNAGGLTLRQLSGKAKELAGKARDNKLHPDEMSGSTFTISNMGMLDVDEFIAIINQPNAAILAVSSVRKQVVATDDDEVDIRRKMNISASFDHRVVDGSVGAKFINLVKDALENPTRLLS